MKKRMALLCSVAVACMLSGCGASVPDLTDEESQIIADYAAGVLLKYDKNYAGRLMDMAEVQATEAEIAQEEKTEEQNTEEKPAEPVPEEGTSSEAGNGNDAQIVNRSQETAQVQEASTIEEYYGIEGFSFSYAGFELVKSYPEETDENTVYFSMDATDGNTLLVVKFNVTNQSGAEKELNMLDYGAKFRIGVNGQQENALSTMLLNDMESYHNTVPAGESVELVSIIEVPESLNVETLALTLRGGDKAVTLQLQ